MILHDAWYVYALWTALGIGIGVGLMVWLIASIMKEGAKSSPIPTKGQETYA